MPRLPGTPIRNFTRFLCGRRFENQSLRGGGSTLFQYFTPRFQKVGWQITGEERVPERIVARPTRPTVGLCPTAAKSARAVIQEAKRSETVAQVSVNENVSTGEDSKESEDT